MKHLILFFFLFVAVKFPAQVNSYLQNNPEWHVTLNSYSGMNCSGYRDVYTYYLGNDTTVNNLTYKEVYKMGYWYSLNSFCIPTLVGFYQNPTPEFFLRSAGKRMYMYDLQNNIDTLLYDFNLQIGDTLPQTYTYNFQNSSYVMAVTAIDSFSTPNGFMKKFKLSGNGQDTLYEGAGSTGGLVESIFPLFLSGDHYLKCYGLNDTAYLPRLTPSCSFLLNAGSVNTAQHFSVFPNPFNEQTSFFFGQHISNAKLSIYSPEGKMMKEEIVSGMTYAFDRNELPPGIYFYRILLDDGRVDSGKLVVVGE